MITIMVAETAIVLGAKTLVTALVNKLVAPKIEQFSKLCKDINNEYLIPKAEHFQEYLERTYEKYSIINTIVLPNTRLKLKDIYIPQTLVKEDVYKSDEAEAKIDKLPVALIKEYKKILITDTAGMGKSTITRRMFIDLIDNGLGDVGIPIYIELNRLNKFNPIIKEIQKELNSLSQEFDNELLLKLVQTGGFIFFFDGYDEISISDKSEVTKDIQTFISKAGTNNYYILTSRPEDELTSFGDFQSFKIKALTKKEAYELLGIYDMNPKKEMSYKLIELLKSGKYRSIDEYLKNPLHVSLLYAAYDHKQTIPLKKHLFYGQVYEAFFDTHDLSKGIDAHQKHSGLLIDDFSRVLRYVGYVCLIKIGVKFDKATILNVIEKAKIFCANLDFKVSDFFKDLQTSVPLFCKDGNEYKWVHKSLMEYFAARFIADDSKERQDTILTSIYNSEDNYKYVNMLDIYYDIDYKGFSKNILLPLMENFIKYHDEHYPTSFNFNNDLLEARIALMFPFCLVGITRYTYFKKKGRSKREFSFFNENVKEGEKWNSTSYGYYDKFVILGYQNQKNGKYDFLLNLIATKHPELFKKYEIKPKKVDKNLYKENTIYKIDIMTGDNDINLYQLINVILSDVNHLTMSSAFNYNAVKSKIESIKKGIELSMQQLDLLP